jgi:oxygen-independent coproporphyrinogen III oxidase
MKQDESTVKIALDLLKNKFINISIDLINGLPFSKRDNDLKILEKFLNIYDIIKHISFYNLTLDKGSKFYIDNNIVLNEKEMEIYEKEFIDIIKIFGFKKYEVSNYTKKGYESIHNLGYWKYHDYLGLGPSAHSTITGVRIENISDLNIYISQKDFKNKYNLSTCEIIEEYLLMGLRLVEGIDLKEFKSKFNILLEKVCEFSILKYINLKKLEIVKNYLKTTKRGMNNLNSILVEMFIDLEKNIKNN